MSAPDQYDAWRSALAGKPLPSVIGDRIITFVKGELQ